MKTLPYEVLKGIIGNEVLAKMTGEVVGEKTNELMTAATPYLGQIIDLSIKIRDETRKFKANDRLAALYTCLSSVFDRIDMPDHIKVTTIASLAVYASTIRHSKDIIDAIIKEVMPTMKNSSNSVI